LETHVERISNLQEIKKAELDRETGLFLYEDMTLGRRFEDKCAEMYYRGKMFGFVHLYNGQEAISTGVIGAMKRSMIGFVVVIAIMFMHYVRGSPHLKF